MKTAVHQYEDRLLEFAYGELPTPEAQAVEAHVRDCAKCSKALSEIRAVRSTMSALPMEAAPDAGLESLLAYAEQAAGRARSESAASRGWRRFLAPLASAMALLLVGVVAWRANQVFDPDPAMLAIEAEREAAASKRDQPTRKGAATESAQGSAAAAAPAPQPVPADPAQPTEALAAATVDGKFGEKKADEQKPLDTGAGEDLAFGDTRRGTEPKKKQAPTSTAKRGKVAMPEEKKEVALADDYSNAALRGATKAPAMGTGYGLGTGSTSTGSEGGGLLGGAAGLAKDSSDKNKVAEEPRREAQGPAPVVAATPPPPPAPSAAQAQAPAPKKSYSLPGLSGKAGASAPSSAAAEAEADELALGRSDALAADRDAKSNERQRAQSRSQQLEAARVASSRGDRQEELRLVLAVLQGGATGYEKVEALKRACDAYEFLGDFERADPYCDQLLAEFPQTAAAGAVAKRRSNVQRAMPAAKPAAKQPAAVDTAPARQ